MMSCALLNHILSAPQIGAKNRKWWHRRHHRRHLRLPAGLSEDATTEPANRAQWRAHVQLDVSPFLRR